MKFVVPSAPGHTVCPSSVGEAFLVRDRTPLRIFRVAPRRLAVRIRREQLPVRAIDHVEESVAIGLRDQMLAAGIDHDRNLRRVPVVLVVLGELEVPVQLAGIGVRAPAGNCCRDCRRRVPRRDSRAQDFPSARKSDSSPDRRFPCSTPARRQLSTNRLPTCHVLVRPARARCRSATCARRSRRRRRR